LAIVYAMERLYIYVYGRRVTVETDQKPLIDDQEATVRTKTAPVHVTQTPELRF